MSNKTYSYFRGPKLLQLEEDVVVLAQGGLHVLQGLA
jgi:hypothetical protein